MSTSNEYEAVPYSLVSTLMKNLNSLASSDFGRTYGLTDVLENIKFDIESINSKLDDVDRQQEEEDVRPWLRRFKGFILAADDLFDGIATDYFLIPNSGLNLEGKVRNFFSSSNLFVYCSQVARDLIQTQKKVSSIVEDMQRLNLSQERASALSLTHVLSVTKTISNRFDDVAFIGRHKEKREIIEQLMQQGSGKADLDVIGIVGIGGMGKTTLAQTVYNDRQVRSFFQKKVWVSLSDGFDLNYAVKKILEALYGDRINDEHKKSFKQDLHLLRQNLKDTKYLLVLDGVWDERHEKWIELRRYLMCGAQGSKILVTTRMMSVAKAMQVRHLNRLEGLNEEDSLSLLKKLVLKNDEHLMNHAIESVAGKILDKIMGHPLSIRSIAGMLCYKSETEWFSFLEHDLLREFPDNFIPHVLEISYKHLPRQLKECLDYCSAYPVGWIFEKNELIQLWMAQGYLHCLNVEQQMEDLGNEFVKILLMMSFFVGKKLDEYGNLVSLEMSDLIRINFNTAYPEIAIEPVHMRLPMDCYRDIDLSDILHSSRVRSFFLPQSNAWEIAHNTIELPDILTCKHLRVLNLSRISLVVLPYSIGKQKHLRYLNLSWCLELRSLPKSIGNLVNLQTLKLTGCEKLNFSTQVITRLTNLRHLEIHRCKAFKYMMPAGLGKLSSLQSLSNFHVVDEKKKAGKLNELQNLNSLRGNLEINGLDQVRNAKIESQLVNMKDKNLLESLDLNWENQDNIDDSFQLLENLCPHKHLKRLHVRWYPGYEFSNWLSSIDNLSHISLFGFNNCKSLPPIDHLPQLESLDIGSMKELEYIHMSSTAATFFQSLKRLKFSGCENLKGWKRKEGDASLDHISLPQFHCLSQLTINKCPKLTDLPTFPNVEEMQLCESMVKPLKETLDMASSSSSSSSTPLSMLKSLRIAGKFPDIGVLPSQWKQNLTSLESLEIGDVDNLDIWFEDNFPSLRKVVVYGCDLQALPQKMCDLSSLQHVKMMGCHKLASLPKEMKHLTKLVTLEIWDCPLLVERCQRESGVDRPQISHVPNIILRQNLRR